MNGEYVSLAAFLILSGSAVLIFFFAGHKYLSNEKMLRSSLRQHLPTADVNYLLSTESVDTEDIKSLMHLAKRIKIIRSPLFQGDSIKNAEIWIVISLIISEHRTFRDKIRIVSRWSFTVVIALISTFSIITLLINRGTHH